MMSTVKFLLQSSTSEHCHALIVISILAAAGLFFREDYWSSLANIHALGLVQGLSNSALSSTVYSPSSHQSEARLVVHSLTRLSHRLTIRLLLFFICCSFYCYLQDFVSCKICIVSFLKGTTNKRNNKYKIIEAIRDTYFNKSTWRSVTECTMSQCTTVSATLVIDLTAQCTCVDPIRGREGALTACALNFLGPEIGTGWRYRSKCAQQPWPRLTWIQLTHVQLLFTWNPSMCTHLKLVSNLLWRRVLLAAGILRESCAPSRCTRISYLHNSDAGFSFLGGLSGRGKTRTRWYGNRTSGPRRIHRSQSWRFCVNPKIWKQLKENIMMD